MVGLRSWTIATLGAFLLLGAACGDPDVIRVPPPAEQLDRFEQLKASAIDILFVIDNSGSMAASQDTLSSNFEHFFHLIDPDQKKEGEDGEVDYRLAVATTDAIKEGGKLRAKSGEPAILRSGANYDPLAIFRERVVVGTSGASREEGFRAAELALETASKIQDPPGKLAFLRPGAYLYVVFVSDEDDESRDEVRYFERRLRAMKGKGNEGTVLVSAIAGPPTAQLPDVCFDEKGSRKASPGYRYQEMVQATGGTIGNICLADWAETLEELAFTGLGLRKRFQLSRPARYIEDPETGIPKLEVLFNAVEVRYPCKTSPDDPKLSADVCGRLEDHCSDAQDPAWVCVPKYDLNQNNGFWFDPRENTVVFGGIAIPGPGSTVVVRYQPRGDK